MAGLSPRAERPGGRGDRPPQAGDRPHPGGGPAVKIRREFIEKIPKTDLHLHLDGSLRIPTLVELARENGVKLPAWDETTLRRRVFKDAYADLPEYLKGFAYTTAVLQTPQALERVGCELARDNQAEGVRYIEVRFAPQLHQNARMSCIDVMAALDRGLSLAKREFNARAEVKRGSEPPFEYGIIACAMRMFDRGFSEYFDNLLAVHAHSERKWVFSLASMELVRAAVEARDKFGLPIVGFDLAGAEAGYPAGDHAPAYALAHRHFLKKTVHAGEAYGPESIFQAITDLHADRLGHAVYLFDAGMIKSPEIRDKKAYIANLVQFIADRRITIEVCLTSNLQTIPAIRDLARHSFRHMRKAKLSATFCTDNRTVSQTTVSDEIIKAVQAFHITPKELKNFVIYGFKRSFFPGSYLKKREYVHQVIEYYEKIEKEFS
ncbi:MAG: adenosine deaminase family protein [Candidatus Aminicenantes bacterium]|nr:adenosine deaminase family protein [Candidatus Aminicenantes bacterium]